ncbi:GATA transcription factor 26-like [Durio zibethinus]|uniref:GATA transcription factor 26-like n=1 Tax=Durio zibethinus TaxID=66656 RepID=A0A6P6AB79_DURZI|nr:GATA transcription factor 26-like [Durio zibethinus]
MRKKGPCFHCGIDNTPLWRNGPPEKPVLCNACGSRYRLGKSLENYTPKTFQVIRKKKQEAVPKAIVSEDQNIVTSNACYTSFLEDYASSESSTSHNYQNCFPIKQENRADNPVENLGSLWGIPSRKRSPVVYGSPTTIQKLRRDLHKILRNEDTFNNNASEGPEDVLIYNININKLQIPSNEIGLGSMLLKFPVSSQNHNEIEPCSSTINCGNVCPLNDAQVASPSLANACREDVDGIQNEDSPIDQQEDYDHQASQTMGAADDS